MRLKLILSILVPFLISAAQLLRNKDENSTGSDDEAANILEAAVVALDKYSAS